MATKEQEGLLERIHVKFEKSQGQDFKKMIDAAKTILDSIGTTVVPDSPSRR